MTKSGTYNGTPTVGNACTACPPNYTCAGGTANAVAATKTCAAGNYWNGSACTACGGAAYYCPGFSNVSNPTSGYGRNSVSGGYYSTGGSGATTRTGQSQCTGATYCSGGVQSNCPTGYTANTTAGKTVATSCQISCGASTYVASANAACTTVGTGWWSAANTVNYGSTSSRTQCPGGYQSGGATSAQANCIGPFTKTGGQVDPATPSGCSGKTLGACTPGTCTAYRNYAGTTTTDCTPSNCTKPITAVTANVNYYVSGTTCPSCSGFSATYQKSDGGNISSNACYFNETLTGSQLDPATPSGCSGKTLGSCTPGTCSRKNYYNQTDGTCTPSNCTKPITAVTANANNYASGVTCTACPAAATAVRTSFPANYYSPTVESTSLQGEPGTTSISQCRILNWYQNSRGGLYEYAYYNTGSGKYDLTLAYGYHYSKAGYYLTNRNGCGAYAYYAEAKDCPAGSYCPGKAALTSCTDNPTNFGLESCPSGYLNSATNSTAKTSCYSGTKSRSWTGSQTACATPSGCSSKTCNSCSVAACDYVAYANSAGTGDGAIKSGCGTNAAACQQTVATVTANGGNYASGITCPACPAGYTAGGAGLTSQSQCRILCAAGTRVATAGARCTTPSGAWWVEAHNLTYGNISTQNYCMAGFTSGGTTAAAHDAESDCMSSVAAGFGIAANTIPARYIRATANGNNNSANLFISEMQAFASRDGSGASLMTGLSAVASPNGGDQLGYCTNGNWGDQDYCRCMGSGCSLTWDMGSVKSLGSIKFGIPNADGSTGRVMYALKISVSADGTNWTDVRSAADFLINNDNGVALSHRIALSSPATSCSGITYRSGTQTVALGSTLACDVCPVTTYDLAYLDSYYYWTADGVHNTIDGCRARWAGKVTDTGTFDYYSCGWDGSDYGTKTKLYACQIEPGRSCIAGYFAPSGNDTTYIDHRYLLPSVCTPVGSDYYSADGAIARTSCPAGTKSGGGGTGADSASDCVPYMSLRNSKSANAPILRKGVKGNSPRHLCVKNGNDVYYGNLVTDSVTGAVRLNIDGTTYYLTDNSTM